MKIEPRKYLITFEDGEEFNLTAIFLKDGTKLWEIEKNGFILNCHSKWEKNLPNFSEKNDSFLQKKLFKYDEAINFLIIWKSKSEKKIKCH